MTHDPKATLLAIADETKLLPSTVDKDYVLGWLLYGIAQHPYLSAWVLKGGTCLEKCFFETYPPAAATGHHGFAFPTSCECAWIDRREAKTLREPAYRRIRMSRPDASRDRSGGNLNGLDRNTLMHAAQVGYAAAKVMMRTSLVLGLGCVVATSGCRDVDEARGAWSPEETSGADGTADGGAESDPDSGDIDEDTGDGTDGEDVDDGAVDDDDSEETGGVPIDCTPAWPESWIGSPCVADGDCTYEGGICLGEDEGFPCGTCSLPCTSLCPDIEGAPVTYCIAGTDVGLNDAGYCVSQCDQAMPGTEGCRDGYVCNVLARFDETGVADVCIPEAFDSGEDFVDEIDHEFLIDHFGGDPTVNAFDLPADLDGFQLYLDAVGVQHVSAPDLAEPYNADAAAMCGFDLLLPEQDQWEKAAALALFTDVLTELVGEPIFLRNWWRPPCYNEAVGGAPGGDHPDADAVDLDFASPSSRALAQQFLCETYWEMDIVAPEQILPGSGLDPRLNMSIGLGGITIHLGVLSAGGRRFWYYDTYTEEPDSGLCW